MWQSPQPIDGSRGGLREATPFYSENCTKKVIFGHLLHLSFPDPEVEKVKKKKEVVMRGCTRFSFNFFLDPPMLDLIHVQYLIFHFRDIAEFLFRN